MHRGNSPCFVDLCIPMHHLRRSTGKSLTKKLLKGGIKLSTKKFCEEEDDLIKRNWASYCEITGAYEVREGQTILGQAGLKGKKPVKDRLFYPTLCRGLLNRTCAQVLRRARRLFKVSESKPMRENQLNTEELAAQKFYHAMSKAFGHDAVEVAAMDKGERRSYKEKVRWNEISSQCGWSIERSRAFWKQVRSFSRLWRKENMTADPSLIVNAMPDSLMKRAFLSKPFLRKVYSSKELLQALTRFIEEKEVWLKRKFDISQIPKKFIKKNIEVFGFSKCRLMARKIQKWTRMCENANLFNDLKFSRASLYFKLKALKSHVKRQINEGELASNLVDDVYAYLIKKRWYQREPEVSD
ncbi:unnamed protein product [Bursaphelenchus xylophilus]|uniref:(pine wood nematode) hypothetical protein n=1 Tax=Bursaphelenchus xylophilus TaxID=6326 RepID=A0A1I7S6J3_BURXY|nr:unnamed protein product [Bursaphelenchus xylophilus]CAG9120494.1 unnamed protein product [Bursaphelenchus xylophilus]